MSDRTEPTDDELRLHTIRYINESKDLASEIGEMLDIGRMLCGEPLPQKLKEIREEIRRHMEALAPIDREGDDDAE